MRSPRATPQNDAIRPTTQSTFCVRLAFAKSTLLFIIQIGHHKAGIGDPWIGGIGISFRAGQSGGNSLKSAGYNLPSSLQSPDWESKSTFHHTLRAEQWSIISGEIGLESKPVSWSNVASLSPVATLKNFKRRP